MKAIDLFEKRMFHHNRTGYRNSKVSPFLRGFVEEKKIAYCRFNSQYLSMNLNICFLPQTPAEKDLLYCYDTQFGCDETFVFQIDQLPSSYCILVFNLNTYELRPYVQHDSAIFSNAFMPVAIELNHNFRIVR
jgi:hypothetical protein